MVGVTPQQIDQVRASFARLQPHAARLGADFYARLFEREPGLRYLFGGDLQVQGHRLISMLAAAVFLLDRPARLERALRELGERHAGYGVQPAHYAAVGTVLLDTLAAALEDDFDTSTRDAWAALYDRVAQAMQNDGAPTGDVLAASAPALDPADPSSHPPAGLAPAR